MAAVSSAAALRGADYENGLRGGAGSAGSGQDAGDDDPMGRGGMDLDMELLGPGRRIRRIGGRIPTGRRSGGRESTESGGASGLQELEEEELEEEEPGELGGDPAIEDPVSAEGLLRYGGLYAGGGARLQVMEAETMLLTAEPCDVIDDCLGYSSLISSYCNVVTSWGEIAA